MNADLTEYISKCEICSTYQPVQGKEPLICHKVPERSWEKIALDYYKTVTEVTRKLRRHFSTHGIPDRVVSDNAPFNLREF